ncbi:chitinase-3-like protein 1 isoform X2 [Palaemon carinicauda]|uniref:chitinase-3-like protein 1 isoform X2 n=1 Tax=Palaemon carinicauda TaxID=392227 RepID=UPI0035B64C6F
MKCHFIYRNTVKMRVLCLLLLGVFVAAVAADGTVVCYFSSWARYRPGDGMFDVDNIDPFLCTHIVFAFTGLSNHTWEIEVLDPWNELCPDEPGGNYCAFKRTVALKKYNPDLKVVIAIGGWNEGSEDYSVMAASPQKRSIFVTSVTRFLRKYGFDGLDFDWEYPSLRGGAPQDKENFVLLSRELRQEFNKYNPPYLLTGAFAAGKDKIDIAYDLPALIEAYDFFHIMAYDYHGAFEDFTHHNAPLCGHPLDEQDELFPYYNVMYTMEYYLSLGLPKEKLVLGTATYGRCYTLDNYNDNGFWAPASQPGPAGPYIRIPGTLGFNEICLRLQEDKSCTVVHDPVMYEPYFYCMSDWIWCGFDDAESLRLKARQAKNKGLAGIMVWQIDTDDFHPRCYDEAFHLIKSMKNAFAEPAGTDIVDCGHRPTTVPSTTPTTPEPTTTTTQEPTTTTTEEPTTTPVPTTTTTPEPTTTPSTEPTTITTTVTTTPEPTTTPTTTAFIIETTTDGGDYGRPDCTTYPEGTTFRHYDCDKYWICISKNAMLRPCGPGTLYDENLKICNYESEVDTTSCRIWACTIDNTCYPAADCDKYYRCSHGAGYLETCPPGEYWNQNIGQCDHKSHVDTSRCNIP